MALNEDFKQAQEDVNKLPKKPTDQELLELYALFKQGTAGDVSGKKPGMFDVKGKFKYEAWAKKKGISKDDAMQKYIDYVKKLEDKYKK